LGVFSLQGLLKAGEDGMIQTMSKEKSTTEFLLALCATWPRLEPRDLLKALHQSVFGCGHFVTDAAAAYLQEELAAVPRTEGPDVEKLDGDFCRFHLRALERTGLGADTLFRLFALSAREPCGSAALLEEKLEVLLQLAGEGKLPWPREQVAEAVEQWKADGYPPCHHSPAFRAAYHPAYRVIHRKYLPWLPLLAAIDRKKEKQVVVAIEGGSANGKTTLAALLEQVYDCTVFHMDDYFLRPEQRTPERLAETGGNVDRERFAQEILLPLRRGERVCYRPFDCQTQRLLPPVEVQPKALVIVEGAYSMHPELAEHYDLSVFLRVSPEVQRKRIGVRNTPEMAARFFSTWIPLETTYFEAFDPAGRCDLILEVEG